MEGETVTAKRGQEKMETMKTGVGKGQNSGVLTEIIDKGLDLMTGRKKTVMMTGKVGTVMGGTIKGTAKIGDKIMVGIDQAVVHKEEGEVRTGIREDRGIIEVSLENLEAQQE